MVAFIIEVSEGMLGVVSSSTDFKRVLYYSV